MERETSEQGLEQRLARHSMATQLALWPHSSVAQGNMACGKDSTVVVRILNSYCSRVPGVLLSVLNSSAD